MNTKTTKKRQNLPKKTSKVQIETIHSTSWNKNRMNAILSQAKMKKILVIGDVGIDRYTIGTVDRISPEAPVPIISDP